MARVSSSDVIISLAGWKWKGGRFAIIIGKQHCAKRRKKSAGKEVWCEREELGSGSDE